MNLQQPFLMPWMNFAAAVTQSQAQMSPVGTLTTVPGQTHLHPQHHHPHPQQVQKLVTLSHHMNPTQAQSTLLSAAQFAQLSAASQYGQAVPQTFMYPNPGSHHAGSGILSPGTLINPYLSAANGGVNNPLGACNGAGIPKMMVQGSTKVSNLRLLLLCVCLLRRLTRMKPVSPGLLISNGLTQASLASQLPRCVPICICSQPREQWWPWRLPRILSQDHHLVPDPNCPSHHQTACGVHDSESCFTGLDS